MYALKKSVPQKNILEMTPVLKSMITLEPFDRDLYIFQVLVPRNSWIEKFSVRFLGQPTHIRVRLDQLGSFVLSLCYGQHRVKEIQHQIEEKFGEKAEPILPRLLKFLEIVEANGWIDWRGERE